MNDITTTVDLYFSLWNEPDPERRHALIAAIFAEDVQFVGPLFGSTGHDGVESMANQLLEHLGDHRFNRTSDIDRHHDVIRYAWEIVPANGDPVVAAGVDFGTVDPSGHLQSITTFLDLVPEAAIAR